MMQTIRIEISYDYHESIVKFPNGKVVVMNGNRHLSGGPLDNEEILIEIIKELGYNVEWINYE